MIRHPSFIAFLVKMAFMTYLTDIVSQHTNVHICHYWCQKKRWESGNPDNHVISSTKCVKGLKMGFSLHPLFFFVFVLNFLCIFDMLWAKWISTFWIFCLCFPTQWHHRNNIWGVFFSFSIFLEFWATLRLPIWLGTLCLSLCTPNPQKVIGIIENVSFKA